MNNSPLHFKWSPEKILCESELQTKLQHRWGPAECSAEHHSDFTVSHHSDSCSCIKMYLILGEKPKIKWVCSAADAAERSRCAVKLSGLREWSPSWSSHTTIWGCWNYSGLFAKLGFILLLTIYLLLLIPHICVLFPDPPAWFYSLKLSEFCFCSNVFAF